MGDLMVQVAWLDSSLFLSFVFWIGVDGFDFCRDPFFFVLLFLSLFLASLRVDLAVAGCGVCLINK